MNVTHQPRARGLHSFRPSRGFTLVELLVVIGIITVLVGIAVPALNSAYKNGMRTRMTADLMVIASGLDAYRGDFADYPRLNYAVLTGLSRPYGSSLLTWALLAPGLAAQDGLDGPGFTLRTSGQGNPYGPYISPDRFKLNNSTIDGVAQICDRYLHPYLYFAANKAFMPQNAYVGSWSSGTPSALYNQSDGDTGTLSPAGKTLSLVDMRTILGDTGTGTAGTSPDGKIESGETAAYTGPYLLWGAGPDEAYGFDPNFTGTPKRSDDVTNYGR